MLSDLDAGLRHLLAPHAFGSKRETYRGAFNHHGNLSEVIFSNLSAKVGSKISPFNIQVFPLFGREC